MPTATRILVSEYESGTTDLSCSTASVGTRPADVAISNVANSNETSRKDDEEDCNYRQFEFLATGPWSAKERALFDKAIDLYGWGNWQMFQIPGRSNDQVKVPKLLCMVWCILVYSVSLNVLISYLFCNKQKDTRL